MYNRGFGGFDRGCWFADRFFYGGWGMLALAAILVAAGILIFLFVKNNKKKDTSKDALERLKTRYVNGELSEEEYLQKKKVLDL